MVKTLNRSTFANSQTVNVDRNRKANYAECSGLRRHEKLDCVFAHYIEDIRGLGLVSGLLIGSREGEAVGYVWNVLRSDADIEYVAAQQMEQLIAFSTRLASDLEDVLYLHVLYVHQDNLDELHKRCRQDSFDLEFMAVS